MSNKSIEEQVEEAAQKLVNDWKPHMRTAVFNAFKLGGAFAAPLYEARGFMKAVEYLDEHENGTWTLKLKKEANRQGFLPKSDDEKNDKT